MSASILFIFTSANKTLTGKDAGYYLPEAAHPYTILSPHYNITFASPAGPNPPLDPYSVAPYTEDEECVNYLNSDAVKQKLANAIPLSEVNVSDYDVIFYPGGHGPVMDLPQNPINAKILEEAISQNRIISAVCHGPAALVGAKIQGKALFHGKKITGFSNTEEVAYGTVDDVPFLLEDRVVDLGGKYEKTEQDWAPYVVVDGDLITGQNPASSKGVAEAIHARLSARQ